jgi:hypothetical protein
MVRPSPARGSACRHHKAELPVVRYGHPSLANSFAGYPTLPGPATVSGCQVLVPLTAQ